MANFRLGKIVATKRIANRADKDGEFRDFVNSSVALYSTGDWGDTNAEDAEENNYSLMNGERILASYIYPVTGERIWIITEGDRSLTTILFPNEY